VWFIINCIFATLKFLIKIIVMYAIVEIAGQQFKVSKDQKVYVHRFASVEAKVLQHLKGDKVIVFKKKRRKGYKKKNGHRQSFTQIVIEGIVATSAKKKAAKKEVEVEVTETAEVVKPKAKATRKPKTEE
jgi:large subunit ribosomal protein L21